MPTASLQCYHLHMSLRGSSGTTAHEIQQHLKIPHHRSKFCKCLWVEELSRWTKI